MFIPSFPRKSQLSGLPLNKIAQVTLELTLAIISIFIFIVGIPSVFVWLNQSLIERQVAYENSRQTGQLNLGPKYWVSPVYPPADYPKKATEGILTDFYSPDPEQKYFHIFKQERKPSE